MARCNQGFWKFKKCTGKFGLGVSKSTGPAKFSLALACWPWSFISPVHNCVWSDGLIYLFNKAFIHQDSSFVIRTLHSVTLLSIDSNRQITYPHYIRSRWHNFLLLFKIIKRLSSLFLPAPGSHGIKQFQTHFSRPNYKIPDTCFQTRSISVKEIPDSPKPTH